uniref:Uncharacterized protein n=1 Tax=Anguilla anguilla TaxID=7936 RepID=A0A0E9X2B8_ANGAN
MFLNRGVSIPGFLAEATVYVCQYCGIFLSSKHSYIAPLAWRPSFFQVDSSFHAILIILTYFLARPFINALQISACGDRALKLGQDDYGSYGFKVATQVLYLKARNATSFTPV